MAHSPPGAKAVAIVVATLLTLLAVAYTLGPADRPNEDQDSAFDSVPDCAQVRRAPGGGVRPLGPLRLGFYRASVDDQREVVTVELSYAIGSPRIDSTVLYLGNGGSLDPVYGFYVTSSQKLAWFLPELKETSRPTAPKGSVHVYNDDARLLRLPISFPRGTRVQAAFAFVRELTESEVRHQNLTVRASHGCATECAQVDTPTSLTVDFACPPALTQRFRDQFLPNEETTVAIGLGIGITSLRAKQGESQTPEGSETHRLTATDPTLATSLVLESPDAERTRYLQDTFLLLVAGAILGTVLAWRPK